MIVDRKNELLIIVRRQALNGTIPSNCVCPHGALPGRPRWPFNRWTLASVLPQCFQIRGQDNNTNMLKPLLGPEKTAGSGRRADVSHMNTEEPSSGQLNRPWAVSLWCGGKTENNTQRAKKPVSDPTAPTAELWEATALVCVATCAPSGYRRNSNFKFTSSGGNMYCKSYEIKMISCSIMLYLFLLIRFPTFLVQTTKMFIYFIFIFMQTPSIEVSEWCEITLVQSFLSAFTSITASS